MRFSILPLVIALSACRTTADDTAVVDADGDSFAADVDCNDGDEFVFPGAAELCNGVDDDCDNDIDDNATDGSTWYLDADGDDHGNEGAPTEACDQPSGHVAQAGDCNDGDADVFPGAPEVDCTDPTDYNCDGSVGFADEDGDGHPACQDCDDTLAGVNADVPETCDGIDNDCDGVADEPGSIGETRWDADDDGDGYGDPLQSLDACDQPAGYTNDNADCNDASAAAFPGGVEVCDSLDNDCDSDTDEDDATDASVWYGDGDADGHGTAATSIRSCTQPLGFSALDDDCDDADPTASPSGTEVCDDADNNCNGTVDEGFNRTWYIDYDGDGHGLASVTLDACSAPSGWTTTSDDCDDLDALISPTATQICNGVDDDCSGLPANEFDADSDTWLVCENDCDDGDAAVNPAAIEIWYDGVDQNCDGANDNDQDGDGADAIATGGLDCDDTDPAAILVCGYGDGADGPLTVTGSTVVNDYTPGTSGLTPGGTSIDVGDGSLFGVGDEVLLIQMQGTGAGDYEFTDITQVSGNTLTLLDPAVNTYSVGGGGDAVQVVRVPNLSDLTVNVGGQISAANWDGSIGGVLALRVQNTAAIDGILGASGVGYRGGIQVSNTSPWNGWAGESTNPSVQFGNNNNNAGGGGSSFCSCGEAAGNGGYGTAGGAPSSATGCSGQIHGSPGGVYGIADLTTLHPGGGGGGGCRDDTSCEYPPGQDGGGIIFLTAQTLVVSGSILSDGNNTIANTGQCDDTIGGAGAGGSVYLVASDATVAAGAISAVGGSGTVISQNGVSTGSGGDGRVRFDFDFLNGNAQGSAGATGELSAVSTPTVGHTQAP